MNSQWTGPWLTPCLEHFFNILSISIYGLTFCLSRLTRLKFISILINFYYLTSFSGRWILISIVLVILWWVPFILLVFLSARNFVSLGCSISFWEEYCPKIIPSFSISSTNYSTVSLFIFFILHDSGLVAWCTG